MRLRLADKISYECDYQHNGHKGGKPDDQIVILLLFHILVFLFVIIHIAVGLAEVCGSHLQFRTRVYEFGIGLEPGGLCRHHGVGVDHSGLEPHGGATEILLRALEVRGSHRQLFPCFVKELFLLGDLQKDKFAGILVLVLVERRLSLGLAVLVGGLEAVEKRDIHAHAGIEHASVPTVAEAVEGIGVGDEVIGGQRYLRKQVGTRYLRFLLIDVRSQ